jgi:Ca-activated chloride channel family protein
VSLERLVHPEWLGGVAAALGLAALALAAARWRARVRARRLLGPRAPRPGWRADLALLAAGALIGAALLGPRAGERSVLVPSRGVDLVLLVDVSRSMDAQDVPPSRLARARQAGAAILAGLGPEDRAALAVFAGRGVLLTPLTPDRDALAELLDGLESDLVRPRGSDLGAGVRRALEAFEPASERPRAILVLSDGEDPARRPELGIAAALRTEARVHAAALGLEAGATVPDHGVALRDARGAVVVTRRRAERLARLAEATGGELFRGDAWGEIDVAAALAAIRREVGAGPGGLALRRVPAVQVAPLAALAFGLLTVEATRPRRRAGRRRALALAAAASALLAGAAPAPEPAPPAETGSVAALEAALRAHPRDPELLVRLGIARLERGRAEEAARAFGAAALVARDPELAALALYDLGVAQLEAGALEAARDAFFDALALAPADREARFNLEWTLRALASRPPEPPPAPEPEPEASERRDPLPAPDAGAAEAPLPGPPPPADAELLRRWLDRVEDDLGRALRSAAGTPRAARGDSGPAW